MSIFSFSNRFCGFGAISQTCFDLEQKQCIASFNIIPFIQKYFITERKGWKYYQGIDTCCHNALVSRMKAVPCLCAQHILRQSHWSYHLPNAQFKDIAVVDPLRDLWINTRDYIPALWFLSIQWQQRFCAETPNRSQNIKEKWQTGFSGNICIKPEFFTLVDIYITVFFSISYSFIP